MNNFINLYERDNVILKVDIISGFLGAGKTRFIKKLINDNFYESRVAIIENEFGEVNIDSTILKKSNAAIKEITAGCICCEVTGYFKEALIDIINNYDVQHIIIEPTGIAKLSEIIKTFQDPELKELCSINHLFTVVDCERFNVYMNNFKRFYVDQIKTAEIIVLSRVQLVDKSIITQVKKQIIKINPNAIILDYDWDEINTKTTLNKLLREHEIEHYEETTNNKKTISKLNKSGSIRMSTQKESGSFQSFTLKLNRSISPEELSSKFKFIASNKSFGKVIRAKGIVTLLNGKHGQFDFALNEYNIEDIEFNGENIISFIGIDLNKKELEHFFK